MSASVVGERRRRVIAARLAVAASAPARFVVSARVTARLGAAKAAALVVTALWPLACANPTAQPGTSLAETSELAMRPVPPVSGATAQTSATAGSPVCLPEALSGQVGYCARLGTTWFRVWGSTKTGKMPKALAADHAGRRLFSSNMGSAGQDGVSVYLTDPLRLERSVALRGNPVELLVTKNDRSLWISDAAGWGQLRRFDTERWTIEQSVAVPGFPKWMVSTRDETQLFASLWALDGVSRVSLPEGAVQTLRTARRSDAGKPSKNPRGMALSSDERELYVLNNHDHTLSTLDLGAWKETARTRIGFAPRHIVRIPGRETYLVSLTGEDALVEWSPGARAPNPKPPITPSIVRRYRTGKRPKTIATSQDGRFAYAANFVGNSLTIVELVTGDTVELDLGLHKPSGLAVRADDHFIYVSGFCSNDIWAVERIEESDPAWEPEPTLGEGRPHRPCLTCASTFAGCPYPPGRPPPASEEDPVKTDAEWGWSLTKASSGNR